MYKRQKRKRGEIEELLRSSRENLEALYSQTLEKKETELLKEKIFLKLRTRLLRLNDERDGLNDYNNWVLQINSAWLAAFSLYDRYKPFFNSVFVKVNSDWTVFYQEVRKLKKITKKERVEIIDNFLRLQ